jgi:hypothetical protein
MKYPAVSNRTRTNTHIIIGDEYLNPAFLQEINRDRNPIYEKTSYKIFFSSYFTQ